jgi:glycine betaine transporter
LKIFNPKPDSGNRTRLLTGFFCGFILLYALLDTQNFIIGLEYVTLHLLKFFGKYFLGLGLGVVLLLLVLACSPLGKIQLGKGSPEYGWLSWIAMLYSTGMGAGLLLRAVQEPVFYYTQPPRDTDLDPAVFALQYTFFHWGLTPWAFYGLFGLIISHSLYIRKGTILTSATLNKKHQQTWFASGMDSLTITCTLFGVVAAVGLGSRQIFEGLREWTGATSIPAYSIYLLLTSVCFLATASAVLGVGKGIRNLSNINMVMAFSLLVFTICTGVGTGHLQMFFQATLVYIRDFVPMSLNMGKHYVSQEFLTDWTYFYWAFWLSWAPFTGVFIARISKGRTIRTFIFGTLIVPVLGTFAWFTSFGAGAFGLIESGIAGTELFTSIYSALFNFLTFLPFAEAAKIISTILVFTFLLTSVDSAIFVLSMFSDKGSKEPRRGFKFAWGLGILIFTSTVIFIGREQLLQAVSQLLIFFAIPFSFLMIGLSIYLCQRLFKQKQYDKNTRNIVE